MKKTIGNYEDILIIGNGFDLNQQFPTSYTDFVNSSDFKELAGQNNYFVNYLAHTHSLQNWIDVENELKLYSRNQTTQQAISSFKDEFNIVSKALKSYLSKINTTKIQTDSHSYRLVEKIANKNYLVLDFNYTDTVKNILLSLGRSKNEIDDQVIKVHGSLSTEIIFGVEDGGDIKKEHVFLRKAYNRNFMGTNLSTSLENCKNLYIFGHSIGETDHMYFENFFYTFSMPHNFDKGKNIELYHFGETGYNQIFTQFDTLSNKRLSFFRQNNDLIFIDTST